MLPIACFRGMQWEEQFRHKLNQHVSSRLETNKFELRGCTPEQALAIVQSRLATVIGHEEAQTLLPFDAEELTKTFHLGLYSPRRVITLANQRLRQLLNEAPLPPAAPLHVLQEAFTQQYQTIVRDFERYPPDRGRLRRALELYVQYGPARCVLTASEDERYIDWTTTLLAAGVDPIAVIFLIDVEQHHTAVGACLARALAFLEDNPTGRAVYIRDARCPFPLPPAWEATNKRLQQFTAAGGAVIFLESNQAACWYALAVLSYAVKEQDVTVAAANTTLRPITLAEFARFIVEEMGRQPHAAFHALDIALTTPSS